MLNNRLNVLDLHRKINQKSEKKSVSYDRVLEICHKRIIAQADNMKLSCWFEFPEYIVGYPLFDLNACMEYCKKQLISNGFLVRFFFPNRFYISWDFDEIKQQKEEQRKKIPLVAMLPSPPVNEVSKVITPTIPINKEETVHIPPPQKNPFNTLPTFPEHLHNKIVAPLPASPPKYDPFDLYTATTGLTNLTSNNTRTSKGTAIDNTFFTKDVKEMLTSSIGNGNSTKNLFDYKPSGKVTLNL